MKYLNKYFIFTICISPFLTNFKIKDSSYCISYFNISAIDTYKIELRSKIECLEETKNISLYYYLIDNKEEIEIYRKDLNKPKSHLFVYEFDISKYYFKIFEFKVSICMIGTKSEISSKTIKYGPLKSDKHLTLTEKDVGEEIAPFYYYESYDKYNPKENYIHTDSLIFKEYSDLFVNDYYFGFNFKNIKFKYSNSGDKITSIQGFFYFLDSYNIFKNFDIKPYTFERFFEIEYFKIDEETYSLKPSKPLYYNPITLEPSSYYIDGFIKTDILYFPFNEAVKLKELSAYIYLDIDSYITYDLRADFKITYIHNLFGECSTSEYCTNLIYDDLVVENEKIVEVKL